eukprot:846308-Prymnesium_polylepis.1
MSPPSSARRMGRRSSAPNTSRAHVRIAPSSEPSSSAGKRASCSMLAALPGGSRSRATATATSSPPSGGAPSAAVVDGATTSGVSAKTMSSAARSRAATR